MLLYTRAMSDTPAHSEHEADAYEPPTLEVISLDCEISAYAPDGDDSPLF
jgi:hypothetical protein